MVAYPTSYTAGVLWALLALGRPASSLSLNISADGGFQSSPILYGFMFEDINHSGDGGIYSQMLRNNGFQDPNAGLEPWVGTQNSTIAIDQENPLTSAIPRTLRLDVPSGATGPIGFTNAGYWGIPVDGKPCKVVFWIKGEYFGDVTARLVGSGSGEEYGVATVDVESFADEYTEVTVDMDTSRAPNGDVLFEMTVDGASAAGTSLLFGLPQLYPTTYKNRENGLKPSLANALEGLQGSFLRFPGGNNLEGGDIETRWKWNETIGPVEERPGRQGTWDYYNTDGLGLDEYLYWCEDLDLVPVLDIWAGFSLDGTALTGPALDPHIDDALKELEYVLGDQDSPYGAIRAANGRTEPWPVTMVEIGNEDYLWGGCESYVERFGRFYDAIHSAYPNLTIITSTSELSCLPDPLPEGVWLDYHNYNTPEVLVSQFTQFDTWDRSHPIFIGEYARWQVEWSDMQSSVAEAVYMIGFERNSDVVKMAAFAPLMQLIDHTQWTPDLIPFTQDPDGVLETTSYYVQQLFSNHHGDTIVPVTSDSEVDPVYWVASSTTAGEYYLKLANYGQDIQDVSVSTPGLTTGTVTIIASDDPAAANTDTETPVVPSTEDMTASGGVFTFTLPAWSVAVLAAE
ncbi:hypothetical protein FQN54_008938 [Arachnomyces sp. PD_36]|nr:hypothetical protein FQN54_008938 [Arachnomyces sp. PD_36]